jgi:threonylcarbamoyladenosine tRNA methylthiotransferase MtaB
VRGPNVSFSKEEIAAQAKRLLAKGYKELVLTGVNISSYGCDLRPRQNLASIVKYLLEEIPELRRLRLSSLDPADIDTELINVIANEDRLMPHIHESIQSGDNIVLKRMLRRHTREQLIDLNQQILQARPDIVLGADLIVGFPTETDEMFSNTKTLLKEANLSLLHIFSFSARDGTAAALMPQVAKNIVTNRAKELKVLAKEFLSNKISEYMGKTVIVLAENEKIAKTNSFLTVRSRKKMKIGRVYSFYCDSIDETIIVGYPISEIIQDSI